MRLNFALAFLLPLAALAAEPPKSTPIPIPVLKKKVSFQSDVLPILKRNCLACHNSTDAEGDLVLETPSAILKGGERSGIVDLKKPSQSLLLTTAARETKPFMPPRNNKVGAEALKPQELAILKAWIEQGATGTVSAKAGPVRWRPLPPGLHPILSLAVTADGQFAACGRANQIFIYHIPTGKVVARLTDPKLADKSARSGYSSAAQRDFVQSLAFSPDGRLLASGEYRQVKLWQQEPNLPQLTLGGDGVTALAASRDGKWIATAGKDHVVRLWDAATGQAGAAFPGHTAPVRALKFSANSGRLASGSEDKTIRVWDVAAGKLFSQVEAPGPVTAVAWLLAGKQIASAGAEPAIRLWELPASAETPWKPQKELAAGTAAITCLEALEPDGRQLLAGGADGTVRQWAVDQRREIRQLKHGAPVSAVAWAPNGKTIATAGGNFARLWSADKGQQLGEMKGSHAERRSLARNEQKTAFAKSEVAYWKTALDTAIKAQAAKADAAKKAGEALVPVEKTLTEKRDALAKIADEKLKPAAEDALKKAETGKAAAEIAVKSAQAAAEQATRAVAEAKTAAEKAAAALAQAEAALAHAKTSLAESELPLHAVAFSPDSLTVATAGRDEVVSTWSAENGAGFQAYPGTLGTIRALAYTADGRLVSAAERRGAIVWRTAPSWLLARNLGTGDEKSPIAHRVLGLDFSPDGRLLATGGGVPSRNGEVKIWRPSDGTLVRDLNPSHSDSVSSVDFSPDGQLLATAGADKFVKVFSAANGQLVKTLSGHTHYVLGVSWRADGRSLASGGADKAIKLWAWPGGEQLKSIENFQKEISTVRFLGLGSELLTASGESRVRLLKEDLTPLREFGGSKGYLFSTATTPDGQVILAGGQDSTLRIWNAATAKSLFTLPPPEAK